MNAREQSLKERCARFGAVISRLELQTLTKRQLVAPTGIFSEPILAIAAVAPC